MQRTIKKTVAYKYLDRQAAAGYLRRLHRDRGLSYKYIAEQIGVTPQTVCRWVHDSTAKEIQPAKQLKIWDLLEQQFGISGRCAD